MNESIKTDDDLKAMARQAWDSLPKDIRSVRTCSAAMTKLGHPVSKTRIALWATDWRPVDPNPVREVVAAIMPRHEVAESDVLSNLPQALRDVLDPRLGIVLRMEGFDKIETAVGKVADAIAEQATDIAKMLLDTETETTETSQGEGQTTSKTVKKAQVARSAVGALAQLATTMQTVTQGRTLISVAHRNFAEGDMLSANGRKTDAKAKAIWDDDRPNKATEIGGQMIDADDANGAMAALQSQARDPKK